MLYALDLFCGGGGASVGLAEAGYEVFGIDNMAQPDYPFTFMKRDALATDIDYLRQFDLIWASPPCQHFSVATKAWEGQDKRHPDLIDATRKLLLAARVPFVMENVEQAPLRPDLWLCGSMFGLRLIRHRRFECHGFRPDQLWHKKHAKDYVTVVGHSGGMHSASRKDKTAGYGKMADWEEAMGIWWLRREAMAQAVPPAYAHYIGLEARRQLV